MSLEILPRHFVEKPWGQSDVPAAFGAPEGKLGEVWFDRADAPLPLLCKWLFTSEKLSVQVHPNDEQARARGLASGKEECWIVTETQGDARLGIGLTKSLSHEELRAASLSGEIEDLLDWKPVKPGDWFHIAPGTVHAIGAGVRLVEIQQNADVTYRLYDYGRPRELHLDDGIAVSNPSVYDGAQGHLSQEPGLHLLFDGPHFRILQAQGPTDLESLGERPCYIVPVKGALATAAGELEPGSVGYGSLAGGGSVSGDSMLLIAQES
ncbi:class I mannose-6-phosphate isomerase [Altererythrobacter sp.]|uniref:class I mannose-6-phosphate isomerase n=1 Tax=Altererythrobacter sp. TaxID=1872480 RepID=UPI003D00A2E7